MTAWQLMVGECVQVMVQQIEDNSIPLTITSPPYDDLRSYHGYTFDFPAIASQLWRVTRPGGEEAIPLNRNFIGIDISATYIQEAETNIRRCYV